MPRACISEKSCSASRHRPAAPQAPSAMVVCKPDRSWLSHEHGGSIDLVSYKPTPLSASLSPRPRRMPLQVQSFLIQERQSFRCTRQSTCRAVVPAPPPIGPRPGTPPAPNPAPGNRSPPPPARPACDHPTRISQEPNAFRTSVNMPHPVIQYPPTSHHPRT
jgi:hypothetical protein